MGEFYALAHSTRDCSTVSVLCTYIIPEVSVTSDETSVALDISSISEYPNEAEVLILPHVSFTVQSVKRSTTEITEIELLYYEIEAEKLMLKK